MRLTFLVPCLLLAPAFAAQAPSPSPQGPDGAPGAVPATTLVDRVAILGASLSDGFGLEPEIGAPIWLGDVLQAALLTRHQPPLRHTSSTYALGARAAAEPDVKRAMLENPTMVIALDYLFWFAYGEQPSDDKRLANLDVGLKLLESFHVPVLLGDVPDMSSALDGRPPVLQTSQVPSPVALDALNARIESWAKDHPNVVVFPRRAYEMRLRAGQEFSVHGNLFFPSELPELFQSDKFHSTASGAIGVWVAATDALVKARKDVPAAWFEWDRQQIYRKLYASKEAERQKRLDEKQKQYERDHPPPPPPDPAVIEQQRREKERTGDRGGDRGG